jgi:hypothetical protein
MRKLGFCVGVALMALAVSAPPALADDTRCMEVLPPGVYDNVVVPEGRDCFMNQATVRGNLKALPGSRLFVSSSEIRGNVEGDKPEALWLTRGIEGNFVGGNVAVTGAGAGAPFQVPGGGPLVHVSVAICDTILPGGNVSIEKSSEETAGTVAVGSPILECGGNELEKGNIFVQENFVSEFLVVIGNAVGGNLQVFKNRGPGAKSVSLNTVREDVQCKENDQPFVGGPNAARKAEDQCFGGAPDG